MMISAPSAGDPYAAAAALDRQFRSPAGDAGDASSGGAASDASPDVVVTLSQGSSSPSTYNASGKLSGAPTLDDLGANAPDSLAHATESASDATTPDASGATPASADASVDEENAVPA